MVSIGSVGVLSPSVGSPGIYLFFLFWPLKGRAGVHFVGSVDALSVFDYIRIAISFRSVEPFLFLFFVFFFLLPKLDYFKLPLVAPFEAILAAGK